MYSSYSLVVTPLSDVFGGFFVDDMRLKSTVFGGIFEPNIAHGKSAKKYKSGVTIME